jgi:malectin (di-glucose binding ER protein)/carbohydrate binding protein with CBM6 domain
MIERLESRQLLSAEVRINSGGGSFRDVAGHLWAADNSYLGGVAKSWPFAMTGTNDPALMIDRRSGRIFRYVIPLDAGNYSVTLDMVEPFFTLPGQRVFDVLAQDQKVISGLDLVAAAGPKTVVQRSFTVKVDAPLVIDFRGVVDEATVSAIDIVPIPKAPPAPLVPAAAWTSGGHVIINWLGNPGVNPFRVQRQTDNSGKWITIGSTEGYQLGFEDLSAVAGHHYSYRVNAFADAVYSKPSPIARLSGTSPPISSTPFKGAPAMLPARIQVEDFDNGGEGISYHDSDIYFNGESAVGDWNLNYRSTPVDLAPVWASPGDYCIAYTSDGDWVDYTISVPTAGAYTITTHAASPGNTGTIHYDLDGTRLTQTIHLNKSANFDTYVNTATTANLPAGVHVLRLTIDTPVDNFDWIEIAPVAKHPASIVQSASPRINSAMFSQRAALALDSAQSSMGEATLVKDVLG